ncbi:hypothetical protein AWH56_010385 [Anaerobacillus isosaccharinicus]|uniref:DUF3298 domain-containing protein n=1 Tax=Anaerobacillus isosaccharinicus TaxID=1532552 RepID=A0A1S2L9P6_9BACI|nr:hypothetical protein [Anaerobacillus isosaccharinicus]MBA5588661.1 hypothetical protein [Anaerobacillus isosaccharinicus]QOY37933.1 hypothetical protein AWH56_010385 [Anaerobacillus isosaccharinicus]
MKMPNDDFLEPLKKRPNKSPNKSFQDSLHEKMLEEVKRRRSMASWKFRLGVVAVLLLLIIINPVELLMTENFEEQYSISKETDRGEKTDTKEEKLDQEEKAMLENELVDLEEILNNHPNLKAQYDQLTEFGVEHGKSSAFILYQYGLLTKDVNMITNNGFFSDYEKETMMSKLINYYEKNVDFSTLTITNIERSLAEPDFFITAQYQSYDGSLIEVDYVLTGYYGQVLDRIKNQHSYFIQKKIIEENGATIVFPFFQGELRGIGESSSIDELNTLIQNRALLSSYDNDLGLHGDVTGKIVYEISSLLSIEFETEWSSEELAHPYTTSFFLTFDLAKGRAMGLLDFISEKELSILEEKIRKLLKYDQRFTNINTEEVTLKNDHSFYLSTWDGNVVYYFPRYDLLSMTEVRIHPTLGVLE